MNPALIAGFFFAHTIPRMTRTVLLATFGSLGDLHPFIAVGQALRARGIEVRLATSPDYQPAVEAAGLEFAPMRPTLSELGDPEEVARRLFDVFRGPERLLREIVMPRLAEQYADLARASIDTDLAVSHTLTFTLPVIAHERGSPWLSAVLAPVGLPSRTDPMTLPGIDLLRLTQRAPWAQAPILALMRSMMRRWESPLRAFRASRGLRDDGHTVFTLEGQHSPYGTLALFDAPLADPQPDWPRNTTVCGAALHDGPLPDALVLGELQRFLDRGPPPIVFALGSAAVHIARDFWREAIAATVALGRRAILMTGRPISDPLPESIRAFDYLPYSRVFPQAAAIAHQVGIGTLSMALRAGKPQLLLPVGMDQAGQCTSRGSAGRRAGAAVPPREPRQPHARARSAARRCFGGKRCPIDRARPAAHGRRRSRGGGDSSQGCVEQLVDGVPGRAEQWQLSGRLEIGDLVAQHDFPVPTVGAVATACGEWRVAGVVLRAIRIFGGRRDRRLGFAAVILKRMHPADRGLERPGMLAPRAGERLEPAESGCVGEDASRAGEMRRKVWVRINLRAGCGLAAEPLAVPEALDDELRGQ